MLMVVCWRFWRRSTCNAVPRGQLQWVFGLRDTLETSMCALRLFPTAEGPANRIPITATRRTPLLRRAWRKHGHSFAVPHNSITLHNATATARV